MYRKVAFGSTCLACETSFWTQGRLAAHLRASPGCVRALQEQGQYTTQIAPGFGSKKRRQSESADFTLSVPVRKGTVPPVPATSCWTSEQATSYRELCDLLHSPPAGACLSEMSEDIRCIMCRNPLYPDEVVSVLDLAHTEVSELHADDPQDPWDAATAALILAALLEVRSMIHFEPGTEVTTDGCHHSLKDFQSLLRDFDWSSALSRRHPGDGTHTSLTFKLLRCWEAEWRQQCSQSSVSAVIEDFSSLLPEPLRQAWKLLLEGRTVKLLAPPEFWQHPIAAPFLGAVDAHLASPN